MNPNTSSTSQFFYKYWWLFYLTFFFLLGLLIYSLLFDNGSNHTNQRIIALDRQLQECANRNIAQTDSTRVISNNGQFGCLSFTLVWNSTDDLDLHVVDALNDYISHENFCKNRDNKFSGAGGQLDIDLNASGVDTNQPVENVYFKCRPPVGIYTAKVHFYAKRSVNPVDYKLLIRNEGRIVRELTGTIESENDLREIVRYSYNESA